MIANTPNPPYYAVIFSSIRTANIDGYSKMADLMQELASKQEGFLGVESARNELGITVSYWQDLDSIKKWKLNDDHLAAQYSGRAEWYKYYTIRIARVERDYNFDRDIL